MHLRVIIFKPINTMRRIVFLSLALLVSFQFLIAQTGDIRGIIFEEATGEFLPGVTVVIEGTTVGTITDLDGKFNLKTSPGTYDLRISYISFDPVLLTGVEVKSGEATVLDDIGLKTATVQMNEVVVTAQAVRNTESALMAIKRKSPNLMDGISAAGLRKIGDSDAASAMQRVTGVSVSGGKYVFVRGLGDRYTKTTLNGVDIPGLDPDRNTLQMDIFPTNILDNLIVHKSFSADLPADFTGGLVDIATKDFPEQQIGSVSIGFGYNPDFHFNSDFLSYEGGGTDWLGFDDGTRDNPITNPEIITNNSIVGGINSELGQQYRKSLESFNPIMAAQKEGNLMNFSLGISLGNQFEKEQITLGYNFALAYKSETEYYEEAIESKYILNNDVNITELSNSDFQSGPIGIHQAFLGGLAGFAVKTLNSKFRINLLHLQNGETTAGVFFRSKDNEGSGFAEGLQHNLEYSQRSITNLLLDGRHVYPENGWTFEWKLSPTLSKMNDPDIRMTQYKIEDGNEFEIDGGENDKPARIWRNLEEINATSLFHITKEFNAFGRKSKLKFGSLYTFKERDFLIETFKFNISGITFTGNPDELFFEENLWPANNNNGDGVLAEQNFIPDNPNSYNSTVNNIAGYIKTELSPIPRLKTMLGIRLENYSQRYTGSELLDELVLDDFDYFPEVNLVYEITSKMNIRASYSQTIARPSFKELSFAQIEDPISGITFNGGLYSASIQGEEVWDGNLKSTNIQNFDFRWEMYFEGGQMVSASSFYKTFENPIEVVQYSGASAVNLQPRNVGNGIVYGAETEFRINLGSLVAPLSSLTLSSNVTLINSEIDRSIEEYNQKVDNARTGEEVKKTRKMAGMAPYIINAGISYLGQNGFFENLEAGLYYNVQGESLEVIGVDDRPNVYSVPFNSLNFNSSKAFGSNKRFQLGFKVSNILGDSKEMVYKSFGSSNTLFSKRSPGTTYSFSFKYKFI
jgi:hypothetical protein